MIHVVDMPMGSGKTESAISYMNEHSDLRFLYVTPFIDETERIVRSCEKLDFVMPSEKAPAYNHRKRDHLLALVNQKRNIAITHALFCMIDDRTARAITCNGYVIIIDEVIDVFKQIADSEADINMLVDAGYLERTGGGERQWSLRMTDKADGYNGRFKDLFELARYGQIVQTGGWSEEREARYGLWLVNSNLFSLSGEIYILTYMFGGSHMCGFLKSNGYTYDYMGTRKFADGRFRFAERGELPGYFRNIREMVHVCEKDSINDIGDDETAFSSGWMGRAMTDGRIRIVSNHVHAFFRRHVPEWVGAGDRLWSTYIDYEKGVGGHGFQKSFLAFNARAVNQYGDRVALAYCVNLYPHPSIKNYLEHIGVEMDWDKYAVSYMVQWIWRSRIRNGKEIWVYIPSRRMRTLFLQWMDDAEAAYRKEVNERGNGTEDNQGRLVSNNN